MFGWEGDDLNFYVTAEASPGVSIMAYEFDLDNDGTPDFIATHDAAVGGVLEFNVGLLARLGSPADDGNYPGRLLIRATGTDNVEMEFVTRIGNTPHAVTLDGTQESPPEIPYLLTVETTDPGPDTVSQVEIDWGDGSQDTVAGGGVYGHTYAYTGIYDVLATVFDEDGQWSTSFMALVGDTNYPSPNGTAAAAAASAPTPPDLSNYRAKFIEVTPDMNNVPWEVHHSIQAGRQTINGVSVDVLGQRFWNEKTINIHEPQYLRGVDSHVHVKFITPEQEAWWKKKKLEKRWTTTLQAYQEVDLDEYLEFSRKMDDDYKDYFIKPGKNQMKRIAKISNDLRAKGGLFKLAKGKASRLQRYGIVLGGAVALFSLFSENAKAAVAIARHDAAQLAAFDDFVQMYDRAIDEAGQPTGLSHNTAILFRDKALAYATALNLDPSAIAKMQGAMGAWIDKNIARP